jgi:hypothetical protein
MGAWEDAEKRKEEGTKVVMNSMADSEEVKEEIGASGYSKAFSRKCRVDR